MSRFVAVFVAALCLASLGGDRATADVFGINGVWSADASRGALPVVSLTIRDDSRGLYYVTIVILCYEGTCPLAETQANPNGGALSYTVRLRPPTPIDTYQFAVVPAGPASGCPGASGEIKIVGFWGITKTRDSYQCFSRRRFDLRNVRPTPSPHHPLPPGTPAPRPIH